MLNALSGDATAYEAFLTQAAQELKSFLGRSGKLRGLLADRADDLVQDVLLSIHRKRDLYRPDMPILPWIHAIAKYRWIDSLRSERRRPEMTEWTEETEAEYSLGAELPPSSQIEIDSDLLNALTQRQREILMLAKVEEVPLASIAKTYGISLSAVKVTVHRAIRAVRARRGKAGRS